MTLMRRKAKSRLQHRIDIVPGDVLVALDLLGIEVADVKSAPSPEGIVEEAYALCPAHDSRTGRPDKWSVNLDTGRHYCFKCGFSGSFVYLVQEVKGYDYDQAAEWVRRSGGAEGLRRNLESSSDRRKLQPRVQQQSEWNGSRLALFDECPPSLRLAQRGISQGSVEKYGVLWDSERDNWILPIRDPATGKLWGYQEKGDGWFCNVPGGVRKSETLFGLDCFEGGTAILLESPLDDLRIDTAGWDGALASYGVQISDRQLEILFDISDEVIFALDNDSAGIKKSLQLRERYLRSGKRIRFLDYSHIMWAKDL
ncbi:MAG TPA: toprim domain-containing protein, partial [Ktedonobacteraceae bacterium]|nr:toprim domain-containing protein [Ktedonobacteraceae bacterium]